MGLSFTGEGYKRKKRVVKERTDMEIEKTVLRFGLYWRKPHGRKRSISEKKDRHINRLGVGAVSTNGP